MSTPYEHIKVGKRVEYLGVEWVVTRPPMTVGSDVRLERINLKGEHELVDVGVYAWDLIKPSAWKPE